MLRVVLIEQRVQAVTLKGVAEFHRMAAGIEGDQLPRQHAAEFLHPRFPLFPSQRSRPDPSYAQRRLAPTFGAAALTILDPHADPRTTHPVHDLRAELERHARPDRQEIKSGIANADVS